MARKIYCEPSRTPHRALLERVESKVAKAKEDPEAWTEVDSLLLQTHRDPYKRTRSTALQLAATYGRLKVLTILLTREEFVKDIGEENEKGETALHLAAGGGHHETVKKLIQYCDREPSSVRRFLNHKSHFDTWKLDEEGGKATVSNDSSFVNVRLPASEKGQSTGKNVHRTALHYASAAGHAETVKYLLSIPEVDAELTDREGNTALHLAIFQNNTNGVDDLGALKELLAVPKMDVNLQGSLGDTPLHKAVRSGNIDAVELLCKQKRLIGTKINDEEMTPLRLAWELQKRSSNKDTLQIVKNTLLDRADVRRNEENLKSEREVLYMAVNALLVGGTLLASVTFAGILEMPTLPPKAHFIQLTKQDTSANGAPIAAQEDDYSDRQWLYVRVIDIFRGSNNMCFFLAVISLMLAIQVPISRRKKNENIYVEEEVEHLRIRTVRVSFCLTLSTFCAGVAFITGGLAKVPVTESGWSFVLSRWMRKEWKLLFKSTMLTSSLSMGFILFIILVYTVLMDYFFIVRDQVSKRFSRSSLGTLFFTVLLFCMVMVVVVLLIFGSGLFQHYYDLP